MKLVRIGAATLNQTPLDWDGNLRRINEAIAEARAQGVGILCLPELCIPGYGCEDAFHSPALQRTCLDLLADIVPATSEMVVSVGLPLLYNKALYNAAALLVDGRIAGFVAKRYLAGDGIHYEPRWFKAWREGYRTEIEIDGVEYPLGDFYFEVDDVKVGFEICEDAWVASRPGSHLARRGVDVILNPSASHFAFDKFRVRKRFVTEGSRAFGVAYVYANLLGCEAGRIIYDGGALIATGGDLVACGPRFGFHEHHVTSAVVDITANQMQQSRTGSYAPELGDDDEECIEIRFRFGSIEPEAASAEFATWEDSPNLKYEEFTRALSLGLFDYMRKSRSRGFVVSLSGGADSTAVSVLVALMVKLGLADLGLETFLDRIAYLRDVPAEPTERDLVRHLLVCVYQTTRNSGDVTRNAAEAVAEAIGAEFHVLDVDDLVEGYKNLVSGAIGRPLDWQSDDVTLQNIQARARGPSVWMFANLRNALLLATSNRSEAAVGYATMDGDTCGGLSPIAGIDKAFLRRWLGWMQTQAPVSVTPIPELSAVTAQAPTAELRPAAAAQTDEGDLMPYDLLDAIEGSAIRDKHSPIEVYREMHVAFPHYAPTQLGAWIERFFNLWCRNQWKRERYAPSFHLDDKNLDPKTWCRFPILSGGFRRELAQMHAYIDKSAGS